MFKGIFTAIVTPFNEDGSLDIRSLEELIEFQIENKITGISEEKAIGRKCYEVFHSDICETGCLIEVPSCSLEFTNDFNVLRNNDRLQAAIGCPLVLVLKVADLHFEAATVELDRDALVDIDSHLGAKVLELGPVEGYDQ